MTSTALVVGGRTGLGAAVVQAMEADGIRVCFTSRSDAAPEDPRQLVCDVDDPASVDLCVAQALKRSGRISALVVAAGTLHDGLLVSADPRSLEDVVRTNLLGPMYAVRALLPHFLEHQHGRIVLVGSASGLRGSPGQVNYAASKSGLVGLARSVTLEYGRRGITCNVVAAGFIDTGMTVGLTDKRRQDVLRQIPVGRLGTADEVARLIRFLVHDASGYISGTVMNIDGGYGMGN